MDFRLGMMAIVMVVTSLTLAPTLVMTQSAEANHYCTDYKGKSKDLIEVCQQGWYDHDHCKKYYPMADTKQEVAAYKKGWNHGSCK